MSEWKPIETAPKDGTDIILGAPAQEYQGNPTEPRSTIGHWATDEECQVYAGDVGECEYVEPYWVSWDGGFAAENPPTHWMPLPKPPQT